MMNIFNKFVSFLLKIFIKLLPKNWILNFMIFSIVNTLVVLFFISDFVTPVLRVISYFLFLIPIFVLYVTILNNMKNDLANYKWFRRKFSKSSIWFRVKEKDDKWSQWYLIDSESNIKELKLLKSTKKISPDDVDLDIIGEYKTVIEREQIINDLLK